MSSIQYDLSSLLVDFSKCPKGTRLVKYFNELAVFEEFKQQHDDDIIKIAILTSDADSPFWKMRGDRQIMIKAIFDYLKIATTTPSGKIFFKSVLEYENDSVIQCWSAYLQMQYNIDFDNWIFTKQTYDILKGEANRQKEDNEDAVKYANWRIQLRNQISKIGEDLKSLEPLVFKDSKMVRPVAFQQVKKIRSYPEKYAKNATAI